MLAVTPAMLAKNFPLYAKKIHEEKETLIITGKDNENIVMLSLQEYNEMIKELYILKQSAE